MNGRDFGIEAAHPGWLIATLNAFTEGKLPPGGSASCPGVLASCFVACNLVAGGDLDVLVDEAWRERMASYGVPLVH